MHVCRTQVIGIWKTPNSSCAPDNNCCIYVHGVAKVVSILMEPIYIYIVMYNWLVTMRMRTTVTTDNALCFFRCNLESLIHLAATKYSWKCMDHMHLCQDMSRLVSNCLLYTPSATRQMTCQNAKNTKSGRRAEPILRGISRWARGRANTWVEN